MYFTLKRLYLQTFTGPHLRDRVLLEEILVTGVCPVKSLVFALVALVLTVSTISAADAQGPPVNHWKTVAECLKATSAPFYYPSIRNPRKPGKNEVVLGHPTGGCFEMDLPDRLGDRGWVRIEPGRRFVYDATSGKVLRLEECDNDIYSEAPFVRDEKKDPPPQPLSETGMRLAGDVNHRFPDPLNVNIRGSLEREEQRPLEPKVDNRNFFRRHWKWLVPVGAAAAGIVICTVPEPRCFTQRVTVTVIQ